MRTDAAAFGGDGRHDVVAAPPPASIISPNLMEDVGPEIDSAGRHRSASLISKLQGSSSGSAARRSSSKGPVVTRSAASTRRDATSGSHARPATSSTSPAARNASASTAFRTRRGLFRQIVSLNASRLSFSVAASSVASHTSASSVARAATRRLLFVASGGARPAATWRAAMHSAMRIVRGVIARRASLDASALSPALQALMRCCLQPRLAATMLLTTLMCDAVECCSVALWLPEMKLAC